MKGTEDDGESDNRSSRATTARSHLSSVESADSAHVGIEIRLVGATVSGGQGSRFRVHTRNAMIG